MQRIFVLALLAFTVCVNAATTKIYKWEDPQGVEHISGTPPNDPRISFQTIVANPELNPQALPNVQRDPNAVVHAPVPVPVPEKPKRVLPVNNIINATVSKQAVMDVIAGSWSMQYDGGRSKLMYKEDGSFTYQNTTQRATFTHEGSWQVYQKRNAWYLRHQGKYFTKTREGKSFNGPINDLYIIKNLSGSKLTLLEAKNSKFLSASDYDLQYQR